MNKRQRKKKKKKLYAALSTSEGLKKLAAHWAGPMYWKKLDYKGIVNKFLKRKVLYEEDGALKSKIVREDEQ